MKLVFLTVLVLCAQVTYAQSPFADSLLHQLAVVKQDTSRVLLLAELCKNYRWVNPDTAIWYGQKGVALARQINYPKGEIRTMSNWARVIHDLGNLPKALQIQFSAIQLAQKNNLFAETGWPLNRIGSIYSTLGDAEKSLAYNQRSMRVFQAANDKVGIATTQMNAGLMFARMNQLDSALYYEKQAYENGIRLRDKGMLALIFHNFGLIEVKKGNKRLALHYFRKSVQVAITYNDHRTSSISYRNIANWYKRENNPDSCIYYAQKSLVEAQKIAYKQGILEASQVLAQHYQAQNKYKQAFDYQQLMVSTKDSLFGAGNIQAIQQMVADEEERQKEIDNQKIVYQNQLKQYALLTALLIFLLIAFILYRNNRQQQRANRLLHRQKEEIDHQRHKAEQALSSLKSTQTQLIQREKMASLGELTAGIAHEIQNPLNFVNNFSELSAELVKELEEEREKGQEREEALETLLLTDLTQNLQKITHHGQRASAIVKGMLEHSRTSSGQKEPTDLNALADEYLRLAYLGLRAKDNSFCCELITDFAPNLPLVNVVPQEIGRVLLNLYNNAFYAVQQKQKTAPPDYQPAIWVSTQLIPVSSPEGAQSITQSNGLGLGTGGLGSGAGLGIQGIQIRVQDNGTGIPDTLKAKIFQPFFTTKPTGEGTGMGLSLSYDIITKGHGGTLAVVSQKNTYTAFTVTLLTD